MSQPVIEFEREKDGRWICEYNLIPGAMAYGETPEKALLNVAKIVRQEVYPVDRSVRGTPEERAKANR